MADRKLSLDSHSSGTSTDRKPRGNLVIKKKLLKKHAPQYQILAGSASTREDMTGGHQQNYLATSRNNQNNLLNLPMTGADNISFMSFTD